MKKRKKNNFKESKEIRNELLKKKGWEASSVDDIKRVVFNMCSVCK